jgi:FkbM family methyltransferase
MSVDVTYQARRSATGPGQGQHRSRLERTARFAANTMRLVCNPRMAGLYLRWQATQLAFQRSPVHHHHGAVRIGNFCSFSHFWWCRDGVSAAEMRLLEVCRRRLPSDRHWIAVDVGAHLGHFTLALAAIGFDEVHAFEPIPDTYRHLQRNIAMNAQLADRMRAHPLGVSDASGSATFAIHDHSPGQSRIATAVDPHGSHHIHCPVTSLDEQFADRPEALLGMVKIDVEGFETTVIRGAARLLAENRIMFVYAEVIPQALREAGSSAAQLIAIMTAANLVLVRVGTLPQPMFVPCSLSEALNASGGTRNVLFAHEAVLK